MLQRIREALAVVLITLLPLHAFLVTFTTLLAAGPGHAPMGSIALWKEGVLALVLLCAALEIAARRMDGVRSFFRFDLLDWCIVLLGAVALIVTLSQGTDPRHIVYGVRYDFVPLVAFFLLRRVEWSVEFRRRALHLLLAVALLVSVYGIATMVLPASFFVRLGYSDLHSLYMPSGPVAAFQQIESLGLRRVQSTMSGPNQLGMWLLLPFAAAGLSLLRSSGKGRAGPLLLAALFGLVILLTFSRAAWIAAALIAVVGTLGSLTGRARLRAAAGLAALVLTAGVVAFAFFPQVVLRAASTRDHIDRPLAAIARMAERPLGWGLGSAGPAQNRVADACMHQEPGTDASWATDRPELCVFVGEVQVQPPPPVDDLPGRVCNCPFLPENWYLQIGVELGVLGLALFVAFIVLLLHRLHQRAGDGIYPHAVFLAMLGVSIAALVLHAWEDSAVAYTLFLFSAMAISAPPGASARRSRA